MGLDEEEKGRIGGGEKGRREKDEDKEKRARRKRNKGSPVMKG